MRFHSRQDAGTQLARQLGRFHGSDTVVLALPRGGIVVAAEVARVLHAPLGLLLVKKIGHPSFPEYAIGALAEDDAPLYNQAEAHAIDQAWLRRAEAAARRLMAARRARYYGNDFSPPAIRHKTVVLVDDGIATGLTMEAAVQAARNRQASRVIVAVPVAPPDSIRTLQKIADEVIVLDDPRHFSGAVGGHYTEFAQVDDEEVHRLLREVQNTTHARSSHNPAPTHTHAI